MILLLWTAMFFGYIFTVIVAHHVMKKMGLEDQADSPIPAIWPLAVIIFIGLVLPISGMIWVCNKLFGQKKPVNSEIVK
jgi:hypothetical protein